MGQVFHGAMQEDAGHDPVYPPVQIARDIFERLADADGAIHENRVAAQLPDGQFEREARAQGRLFE